MTARRHGKSPAAKAAARQAVQTHAASLKDQLEQFLADLGEDELAALLAGKPYAAKYHGLNPARILMQDPAATDVRGHFDWLDAGRAVRPYPDGEYGITIVQPLGKDDEPEPDPAGQPGEISSDDLQPKRLPFTLLTVHDVRNTDPVTCGTCGAAIHRTGRETKAQMQARGGRRQAALWTHTAVKPADGHKAVRPWQEPAPRETEPKPELAEVAS